MAYNRSFGSKHVTLGEDTKGMDLKAFGDTTGKYFMWDASADGVVLVGGLTQTGNAAITGNATVSGTLGITGATTATGGVSGGNLNPTLNVIAGENIAKYDLVYISGYDTTSGKLVVKKADADLASPANVAQFIAPLAITNAEAGTVVGELIATAINTDAAAGVGSPLWLSDTAGGFAVSAPTTAGDTQQCVGVVVTKNATTGSAWFYPFYSKATTDVA